MFKNFPKLFGDVPTVTTVSEHAIAVVTATPIKRHTYRVNLKKHDIHEA